MSELEPVEPEEAVEYLFQASSEGARVAEHADAEVAQPLDDEEELEEIAVIETAVPVDEPEQPESKLVAPPPIAPPPIAPPRKSPTPTASSAPVKPFGSAKSVAPVKPFKHPVPAKSPVALSEPRVEKYFYITGGQLVTMMITLPLMSAAISMGSMYLGHVITEESRSASQVLARIPRLDLSVPAPVVKAPAQRKPAEPKVSTRPVDAPAVDLTAKPESPSVVAVPASAIEETTLPLNPRESTAMAVLAVQAPVANDMRYSAEVVSDMALENVVPASAMTQEKPASPTPAEAPKAPPRAFAPVTGRSSSYFSPIDDSPYVVNVTARDEVETVVPMAPPALATRAVEVEMPAATFEAPDAQERYAEVLNPPAETASAPKPPVTVTVVVEPAPVVPPPSSKAAEPLDETMLGEVLPRSDAEITREKADDARRVKR